MVHLNIFPPVPGDGDNREESNANVEMSESGLDGLPLTVASKGGEDEPGEEEGDDGDLYIMGAVCVSVCYVFSYFLKKNQIFFKYFVQNFFSNFFSIFFLQI